MRKLDYTYSWVISIYLQEKKNLVVLISSKREREEETNKAFKAFDRNGCKFVFYFRIQDLFFEILVGSYRLFNTNSHKY